MTDTQTKTPDSVIYGTANNRGDADSVTLLRILDTLYAILGKSDPNALKKLVDLHHEGGIMGPAANYNSSKMLDNEE